MRRTRRVLIWSGGILAVLVVLLAIASAVIDKPLRGFLENKANARLKGYKVHIGAVDFRLYNLSLALLDARVVQEAHPDPPVALLPKFRFSVQWRNLVRGKVVADLDIDRPQLHIDVRQLTAERRDPTKFKDHGWQPAVEALYPLKINQVTVADGALLYLPADNSRPLDLGRLNFVAHDIRNVRSARGDYPSAVRGDAVLFERGRVRFDGHADFLAEPYVGFKVNVAAENVPLERLDPLSKSVHVRLQGGAVGANGTIEMAPWAQVVLLREVVINGVRVDYVSNPATKGEEKEQRHEAAIVAKQTANRQGLLLKIDRLQVTGSEFGFVNDAANPPFRVFFDRTDLSLTNISNQAREGDAVFRAHGRFMGRGATQIAGTFRPDRNGADFELDVRLVDAPVTLLNDVLRAYAKFDVADGQFSIFSQVRVKNGYVTGYVKPLFKDIRVYDETKDKDKPFLKKLYEKVVQGLASLLKNRPRDEVATVAEFSGPIGDAHTDNLQAILKLIQNAFFRAILPGFEKQVTSPFSQIAKSKGEKPERTGSAR